MAQQQLHQHAPLLHRFALAISAAAKAACKTARTSSTLQPPSAIFGNGLSSLLTAILQALSQPPTDVFADVGGAPAAPNQAMQAAAERWQEGSVLLLCALREVLEALASLGLLQPLHGREQPKAVSGGHADKASDTAGNFWSDLKLAAGDAHGAEKSADTQLANGGSHEGARQQSGNDAASLAAASAADAKQGAGKAKKKPLIEVLETADSHREDPQRNDGQKARRQKEAAVISGGGVVIEELAEADVTEAAGADVSNDAHAQALTERQLAPVLLACALQSTDPRLDAPWASLETSASAATVLESLAALLSVSGSQQRDRSGAPFNQSRSHHTRLCFVMYNRPSSQSIRRNSMLH
jgi:hypothetical protein